MPDVQPITVDGTIVEILGDGVWPQMAAEIRENLIAPFFTINWEEYDLGLVSGRDATDDKVLEDTITALKTHKAGVKGPTVTPTLDQAKELGLKKKWGSPNGIIRRGINGAAIFRSPIDVQGLEKNAPKMAGVCVGRFAVGDIYGAPEFEIPGAGTITITFKNEQGEKTELANRAATGTGVGRMTTETNTSIRDYATAVFDQALAQNKPVVLGLKDTIAPTYDGRFLDIFKEIFEGQYKDRFTAAGLSFQDMLIDAVATKIVEGKLNNTLIALKNYDGDVLSDEVAGAHISLGMMDSSLVSADGIMMTDPPHGTAPDLEDAYHKEGKLLANPAAYIVAYAEAIRHKAAGNGQDEAAARAEQLKKATVAAIEAGHKTGDLTTKGETPITGQTFIAQVRETLADMTK